MLEIKDNCVECPLAHGLLKVIENQFKVWGLTAAEIAVCRSLLVGKSLRQISEERSTNVVTVRQQALAVYGKSGTRGRHDLSAFFLRTIFNTAPKL